MKTKPIADFLVELMDEGLLDPKKLSINLIKFIGWKHPDLTLFMKSYYPYTHLHNGEVLIHDQSDDDDIEEIAFIETTGHASNE